MSETQAAAPKKKASTGMAAALAALAGAITGAGGSCATRAAQPQPVELENVRAEVVSLRKAVETQTQEVRDVLQRLRDVEIRQARAEGAAEATKAAAARGSAR